jgi:hypothetical protein
VVEEPPQGVHPRSPSEYEGRPLIDIRTWFTGTSRGSPVKSTKALAKARELGLVSDEQGE